jgi:hypothetical protein
LDAQRRLIEEFRSRLYDLASRRQGEVVLGLVEPRTHCFGIDLPKFDGDDSWRLPVPARIVLAKGGAVVGIEAEPDYTRRPEPEETLAVLKPPA